ETVGDPFRHLSDKSLKAWKVERWMVHGVLVFAVVMTIAVLYSFFSENPGSFIITKTVFLVILLGGLSILAGLAFHFRNELKTTGKYTFPVAIIAILSIASLTTISYLIGSLNAFFIDSYLLR